MAINSLDDGGDTTILNHSNSRRSLVYPLYNGDILNMVFFFSVDPVKVH